MCEVAFLYVESCQHVGRGWFMSTCLCRIHRYHASHSCVRWHSYVWNDNFGWRHTWMSHVSYEWVVSQMMGEDRLIAHVQDVTCKCCDTIWVMSRMNESCLTWMSHVSHEWVMSHMNESSLTWMSHVSHEWVMSHRNDATYEWVASTLNEYAYIHIYIYTYTYI